MSYDATNEDDSSHHREEIDRLVAERSNHRKEKRWKEADRIKAVLEAGPASVELIDRCDGSSSWRKKKKPTKIVQWSKVDVSPLSLQINSFSETDATAIPLVLATVDSPHYRSRLGDTLDHLNEICGDDTTRFCPEPVDMLDLSKHPLLGSKRILFEGWRTVLLPHLLRQGVEKYRDGFVLVAEDDVRFPPEWTPNRIRFECIAALRSNPDLHVLSLGHRWAAPRASRRQRRRERRSRSSTCSSSDEDMIRSPDEDGTPEKEPLPLLNHLQEGGGVHASTLFAIRAPEGLRILLDALNGVSRQRHKTHLDQFLFLSTLHNVGLALSDPPLVGWAEVSTTLTSAGPGFRRRGGGRLGHLPAQKNVGKDSVEWVQRQLVTKEVHHVN